jgi:nucleoid-associated protein YgaU
MKKLSVGGLALALLVLASENTAAQEQKMTCEEYMALGNELVNREVAANTQIEELNAQLEGLNMQIAQLDQANLDLNAQILEAVGHSESEVMAFGRELDAIIAQLEGLIALAPEVLIMRRGEVTAIDSRVAELKQSNMAALPEMMDKLATIDQMLADLKARIAQPVVIDYKVMRGDNLWNISKKEQIYDDPYMWPRIYRKNKDQIKDPDLIYPNQVLAVPFGVAENQYLVTRGDFLFKIAAELYNNAGKWHKIYEANKQQIVAPDLIFPAQVLEIPQ